MLVSVKTYGQFCPVAMALEVLAERWTLLVVRELLCGSRRFNDLARGVPQMSRTMLSQRLKTLEEAGVVIRVPSTSGGTHEYCLTQAGEELESIVMGLGAWGQRWSTSKLQEEHLDASLLMWDMQRRIDHSKVPPGRIVIRFDIADAELGRYWLRLEDGTADVCFVNPGFDVQLVVETDLRTLTDVWMGKRTYAHAVRDKLLNVEGKGALKRQLPHWLELSIFASVEPPSKQPSRA